jgi:hypothetical protein
VSALQLETDRTAGALLCVIGGIVLGVGTFSPWITATAFSGESLDRSVFQLGAGHTLTFDGPLCLVLGIFAIVIGLARLISKTMPSYLFHAATLSPIAAGVVLVYQYPDIDDLVQQVHAQVGVAQAFVGIGFWICCVGAIVPVMGEFVHWAVNLNREFNLRCVERQSPSGEGLSGRVRC